MIVAGSENRVDAGVWMMREGEDGGRRGLSFKTSFSRDFMGSTRAGNSLEETETARDTQETQLRATYMLSEFGDSMRRRLIDC